MADDKHIVRFEPVGIEIEVDEEQTILRAAAEQGIMLMHGCKEGQCAACKSFVLEGEDVELDKYSTFALPDCEKEEGFTLLCRAHVYEDVTIELLNYDEEMIRSGLPIQTRGRPRSPPIDDVTHDMRHVIADPARADELRFFPGQYVDITVPGTEDTRSFSMANVPTKTSGQLEFVIKVYPDGRFSSLLPAATSRSATGSRSSGRSASSPCARQRRPDRLRRRRRRHGADPVAAALAGRARTRPGTSSSTTAPGPRATSASRTSCTRWSGRCRASATCRPCPSRTATTGTARSASSPTW